MNNVDEVWKLLDEYYPEGELYNKRKEIIVGSDGLASSKGGIQLKKDSTTGLLPFKWRRVDGSFWVSNRKLKSLWGSPFFVGGDFFCSRNKITTLQYCPQYIGGHFWFRLCPIKTLRWFPREVHGNIGFHHNDSLEYLQLLKVKGWKQIIARDSSGNDIKDLSEILSKYSGKGLWYWSRLRNELTKAGYEKNARFPGGLV